MLNEATVDIYNKVRAAGYDCCILKGQANAAMYPNPAARTPGDVDSSVQVDNVIPISSRIFTALIGFLQQNSHKKGYFYTKDLYNNKKRLFSRCFHGFINKNHVKRPTK
jgi:hypothetical protein